MEGGGRPMTGGNGPPDSPPTLEPPPISTNNMLQTGHNYSK